MSETSVPAQGFSSEEGSVHQFDQGRVCKNDSCGTLLSIYNDGEFCSRHEPMVTPRMRGVKIG